METHGNKNADDRSHGSFSSDDIDIDVDAVLAQSNPNISNVSESPQILSPVRHDSKIVKEQQTEHQTPDVHLPVAAKENTSLDDSHSVDQIVQIDIVGGSHVRIYHGSVGVGRIHAVNDVEFDAKQPISMLDMLQLLALQPLHSLDVQPVSEISLDSGIQERLVLRGKELQIRFVVVPEGSLGLELAHTPLAQALGIPVSSSQTLGCGFRIEKQLPHHPPSSSGLSVGDVIVAVNDASIVLLSAPTAAAMLAQKKTRKFTVVRTVKPSPQTGEAEEAPDHSDAQIYFKHRSGSPAGRQRLRRFIREEIERKYAPDDVQGTERTGNDSSDSRHETRDVSRHFPSSAAKRRCPSPADGDDNDNARQRTSQFINDDDDDDDNDGYQEPLHKRWCEVRRTFLCHTMYKPVPDRAAASRDPFAALADPSLRRFDDSSETNWAQQYSDVLYRQRFLEVIHANDGSQALKRSLLRRFQSKANT